jgi:FXSXX-COOH protein
VKPQSRDDEVPEPSDCLGSGDFESDLPDLTEMSLGDVRISGDSALAHALARLVEDLRDPDNVVAGFQSAL